MYSLKVIPPSKFTELSKAFDQYLSGLKVEMIDRRDTTSLILAKVLGHSLPIQDCGQDNNVRAKLWREQYLPGAKEWLGRLAEAFPVDSESILIGAYNEWCMRCNYAFPFEPLIGTPESGDVFESGWPMHQGALAKMECKYKLRSLPWNVSSILLERK